MSDDEKSTARTAQAELGEESSRSKRSEAGDEGDAKPPAKASRKELPKKRRRKAEEKEHVFPVKPSTIQVIKRPRTYVNHSYRDFSNVPPEAGDKIPANIAEKTFAQKVHDLLSSDNEFARQAIEWCTHGRAFRIISPNFLENSGLLKTYFDHGRHSKFLKQLVNYGFKRLTEGRDSGCFYSEVGCMLNEASVDHRRVFSSRLLCSQFLLRGLPHLTKYAPELSERRKVLEDPENEPDFYKISELFPLPDAKKDMREEAKAALAARGIIISNPGASMATATLTSAAVVAPNPFHDVSHSFVRLAYDGLEMNAQIPHYGLGIPTALLGSPNLTGHLSGRLMSAMEMAQLRLTQQARTQALLDLYSDQSDQQQGEGEKR